jgi:hypothetical protein
MRTEHLTPLKAPMYANPCRFKGIWIATARIPVSVHLVERREEDRLTIGRHFVGPVRHIGIGGAILYLARRKPGFPINDEREAAVVGVVEYSHGGGASCRSDHAPKPTTDSSPNHPVCSWILPILSNLTAGSVESTLAALGCLNVKTR